MEAIYGVWRVYMGYGGYIGDMEGIYRYMRIYTPSPTPTLTSTPSPTPSFTSFFSFFFSFTYIYIPFAFLLLCNHPLPHHLYLLYLKFNSLITFSTLNHTLFATLILSLKLFTFILTFTLSINYIFLFHFCDFIHT